MSSKWRHEANRSTIGLVNFRDPAITYQLEVRDRLGLYLQEERNFVMTVCLLLATWIFWIIVLALVLRFILGGVIDCFKKGSKAGLGSWMGFTVGVIIVLIIALCI